MKKLKIILQSNIFYLCLFIFLICYVFFTTKVIKYESNYTNTTEIEGIITDVSYKEDKISFTLKGLEKIICNVYLKENDLNNYKELLGKRVKVFGKVKSISNNTIPNTFNYKEYLYNKKIYNTFTVSNIEILDNENIFYKIKNKIINKINTYNDIKAYISLFIIGDKTYLDNNVYESYRTNGIWHLFAVSGMHISLIISVLHKLFKKIKFKNIFISLILFYFMFLTSFSASVMRSTIFYYLKKLFDYLNISLDNKKILFLVTFIILLINPFMFYNVGFRYSFLISYVIMLVSKDITGSYFIKIFKISIISFIVSLPITVNMNYEVNILSIILNIFYVPFISFIIFPLCIITFILPILSPILKLFIIILEVSNTIFSNIELNIIIPKMSLILIILYYIFLYTYYKLKKKKYLIFLFISLLFNQVYPKLDNNSYIYFFDVSQGDSALIIYPYHSQTVMLDTGGLINSDYHISNNTLTFLKSLGINKIDYLILTHGDYDHMGDAINLVNNFKVDKVILNCGSFNELENSLINVLEKKKIIFSYCINNLNINNNKLFFLNNKDYDNENDNSSVIYTELNNYKFLFMGDASIKTEQYLIEKYHLQNIDVLKVGHHGSKTSSGEYFINITKPKYSIISVGKNNRYNHPNNSVLDILKNSKIYRTDKDGSIRFKINKNKFEIETYIP